MKISKSQVECSVLFFAQKYGIHQNYVVLIDLYHDLINIVKMIVYEMFVQKFNSYYCTNEEYEHYKIIHEYTNELRENGFVVFN